MKKTGKIKRYSLHIENDPEVIMIGLVTPEADYKISLLLNKSLNLNFKSITSVIRENETGEKLSFPSFKSTSELNDNVFILVSNKQGSTHLSKKLTGIDFLLIIRGSDVLSVSEKWISHLRTCREINALFTLDDLSLAKTILVQTD